MSRFLLPLAVFASACLSGFAYWKLTEPPAPPSRKLVVIALSPSGRWIAAAGTAGWVSLLDRENADHPRQFRAGDGAPSALAFSEDERSLAVVGREVAIYSVESMDSPRIVESMPSGFRSSPLASAPPGSEPTSNVIVGPQADTVIFGTSAGSVEIWDRKTEKILWQRSLR